MTDLIARLEAAEGGSRELDVEILASLGFTWRGLNYWNYAGQMWRGTATMTCSLDAALALAERVLPKLTRIEIKSYVQGEFHHCAIETDDGEFDVNNCRTPALALCAAILRAKASPASDAQEGEGR